MEKVNNYDQVVLDIKKLIKDKHIDKAMEICGKYEYKDIENVQAEKMFILSRKFNDYKNAYDIWVKFKDSNNINIVINGLDILLGLNKLDEALEYANKHSFDDIKYIRIKLKILLKLDKKAEILELGNNDKYKNDEVVKRIVEKVIVSQETIEKDSECSKLSNILTRIYLDDITKDEIKESEIEFYNKSVLMLAYYEKHNKKAGL